MKEKIKLYCVICNKLIGEFYPSERRKTCSKECHRILVSQNTRGIGNPRYIDGRSSKQSYCECGKVIDNRSTYCQKCKNKYYNPFVGKHHTAESKKIIGEKSSKKFTNEFKQEFRKTMEKIGTWTPLGEVSDYKIYFVLANWISRMFDIQEIEGLDKLNKFGIFNCRKNSIGVVRDHRFSRRSGFELGVFPEILRHPKNCEFLLNSENVSKKRGRYKDKDSITLDELFNLIENYSGVWKEQEKCLQYIKLYRNGERYNKLSYLEDYYEKTKK